MLVTSQIVMLYKCHAAITKMAINSSFCIVQRVWSYCNSVCLQFWILNIVKNVEHFNRLRLDKSFIHYTSVNVTWLQFDQSAEQLVVDHTTDCRCCKLDAMNVWYLTMMMMLSLVIVRQLCVMAQKLMYLLLWVRKGAKW